MVQQRALLGIFQYLDDLLEALQAVRKMNVKVHTVYSPTPRHELHGALGLKPSPVRYFTLIGGLLGLVTGLSLASYAGLQWKFITSGKPVLAWIPFMVVGFEFFILFAVFATLIGMLVNSRMPRVRLPEAFDPRFTQDRFGMLVICTESDREKISGLLKEAGAEEVHDIER